MIIVQDSSGEVLIVCDLDEISVGDKIYIKNMDLFSIMQFKCVEIESVKEMAAVGRTI